MEKIKVIFLDVDGVLNNNHTKRLTSWTRTTFVDDKHIRRLKHIINATDARVVLSSDWRYDREDERYNLDFLELRDELLKWKIEFYGFTPEVGNGHRGTEIDVWLKEHDEVTNFVILDDRKDMEPHMEHLVQTTLANGLLEEDVEKAIEILNM